MRGQTLLSDRESCLFDTSIGFQSKERANPQEIPKVFKQKGGQLREGEPGVPPDMADRMMLSSSARCSPNSRFLMTRRISMGEESQLSLHNTTVAQIVGGAEGDRTPDLMTASHALSQLSYGPARIPPACQRR
jgi:hypothetical protein